MRRASEQVVPTVASTPSTLEETSLEQRSLEQPTSPARLTVWRKNLSARISPVDRQQSFVARKGVEAAAAFLAELKAIRDQIKGFGKKKRFVLRPGSNRWLSTWEIVTALALVYTALLTPFEAAFTPAVEGPLSWSNEWFLINRVLDVVFLCDMLLQFFLSFESADATGFVVWADSHKIVVEHYLKSWFALDLLTCVLPVTFDLYLASKTPTPDDVEEGGDASNNVSLVRVLRALRLVKLVRLVRASRAYERWKARIALSYSTQNLVSCFLILAISSHWAACTMGLTVSLSDDPTLDGTWAETRGLCTSEDVVQGAESALAGCSIDMGTWYLSTLLWAVMIVLGVGGTEGYPSATSNVENGVMLVLIVLGAFLWTMIIGMFVDVATNGNPGIAHFNRQLECIHEFIVTNNLPKTMARRLREYLHQQKIVRLLEHANRAIPMLSPALQIEVVMHCHGRWLNSIWFLGKMEEVCKVRLAMSMHSLVLAPGEIASLRHLYVVTRGLVLFGGRIHSRGSSWGDDVILTDTRYFLPFHARAMTYVDAQAISRETLLRVVSKFPASGVVLRRASIWLALRRHIVWGARAETVRRAAAAAAGEGQPVGDSQEGDLSSSAMKALAARHRGKDMIDQVIVASEAKVSSEQQALAEMAYGELHTEEAAPASGGNASVAMSADVMKCLKKLEANLTLHLKDVKDRLKPLETQQRAMREDVDRIRQAVLSPMM